MDHSEWLVEVDHTGDAGFVVTAPSRRTLFERAAAGMFAVLVDPETVRPTEERSVEVTGSDPDDLLVRWLSELNFLHLTEGFLFNTFRIEEMGDTSLLAVVGGERIDPARHAIHTEVKAVTYHGLHVAESDGEWKAQVIFDM